MVIDFMTREILWSKADEEPSKIVELPQLNESEMSEEEKQLRDLLKKAQGL